MDYQEECFLKIYETNTYLVEQGSQRADNLMENCCCAHLTASAI